MSIRFKESRENKYHYPQRPDWQKKIESQYEELREQIDITARQQFHSFNYLTSLLFQNQIGNSNNNFRRFEPKYSKTRYPRKNFDNWRIRPNCNNEKQFVTNKYLNSNCNNSYNKQTNEPKAISKRQIQENLESEKPLDNNNKKQKMDHREEIYLMEFNQKTPKETTKITRESSNDKELTQNLIDSTETNPYAAKLNSTVSQKPDSHDEETKNNAENQNSDVFINSRDSEFKINLEEIQAKFQTLCQDIPTSKNSTTKVKPLLSKFKSLLSKTLKLETENNKQFKQQKEGIMKKIALKIIQLEEELCFLERTREIKAESSKRGTEIMKLDQNLQKETVQIQKANENSVITSYTTEPEISANQKHDSRYEEETRILPSFFTSLLTQPDQDNQKEVNQTQIKSTSIIQQSNQSIRVKTEEELNFSDSDSEWEDVEIQDTQKEKEEALFSILERMDYALKCPSLKSALLPITEMLIKEAEEISSDGDPEIQNRKDYYLTILGQLENELYRATEK